MFNFRLKTPEERAEEERLEKFIAVQIGIKVLEHLRFSPTEIKDFQKENQFGAEWNITSTFPNTQLTLELNSSAYRQRKANSPEAKIQAHLLIQGLAGTPEQNQAKNFPLLDKRDPILGFVLSEENLQSALRSFLPAYKAARAGKPPKEVIAAAEAPRILWLNVPFSKKDYAKSIAESDLIWSPSHKAWGFVGEKLPKALEAFLPNKEKEPEMQ